MPIYQHSILIQRPIEVVYANATCLRGCVNWQASVIHAEQIGNEPVQVGTRYRHSLKFMGMTAETQPEVTVLNPPYEFAFKQGDAPVPMESFFVFEPVPEGTRFTVMIESEISPSLLGRLTMPVFLNALKRQFDSDMSSLKDLLESDITVHA